MSTDTYTSLATGLPPEIAAQVSPQWQRNEAVYWANRENLLPEFEGQWIAYADGQVIDVGDKPVPVFHAAHASGKHPFVARVGHEYEPARIRRTTFVYDASYSPEPLPVATIEFRRSPAAPGEALDRVIPDTGADATTLPWSDCQSLQLQANDGTPSVMSGASGGLAATMMFLLWAHVDSISYACRVHADFADGDRILGRDVLNQMDVLFRGPRGEVVFNP